LSANDGNDRKNRNQRKNRKGGGGPKRPDKGGGTGAALGTQVLRYSGIHGIGMVLGNAVTFASTIVIANFSEPGEFGQLGLLMFYSGLLTILFTLASKQGTLKRTFGGDDEDDDDDDDEDDDELAASPRRSLGTGLVTITIVSIIGTGLSIVFADQISHYLLGDADPSLVMYAALAGGTAALYRVSSIAIWIERRPKSYIAVEVAKPIFILAAVVPLLIAGEGITGAIAGQAIGTGLALLMSLVVLRGSWELCWDWREAIAIYKKGAIRVPLVLSMWVVGYADIFILSRFVDHTELGTYHLASRAAFLVAVLPGGYRKALRPLQKTPMFRAVEDEYGVGNARGIQFGYFTFVLRRRRAADPARRRRPRRPDRLPDDQQVGEVRRQARPVHHRRRHRDVRVRRADAAARRRDRRQGCAGGDDAGLRDPDRLRLHALAAGPESDHPAVAADDHLLRPRRPRRRRPQPHRSRRDRPRPDRGDGGDPPLARALPAARGRPGRSPRRAVDDVQGAAEPPPRLRGRRRPRGAAPA
jgi:hypothetical protein